MVNGKQKGAAHEREVCWALSRFVDPKGQDTLYWRSAMSGGRATVQSRRGVKNTTQLGDITSVSNKGRWLTDTFVLECKSYKSLDLGASLLFGKGKLATFWRELQKISSDASREPLLIAKQNRTETLVLLTNDGYQKLAVEYNVYPLIMASSRAISNVDDVWVCLFKDVFVRNTRVRRLS